MGGFKFAINRGCWEIKGLLDTTDTAYIECCAELAVTADLYTIRARRVP